MIPGLPQRLDQIPEANLDIALAAAAAVGLLYCFAGYRTLTFLLGLSGFALAGATAAAIAAWITQGHLIAVAVAGIAGGICGAMALLFLFRLAIFLIGAAGAVVAGWALLAGRPEPWAPWAMVGIALAGGLLAVLLERPALTLATAAIGAWIAAQAGAALAVQHWPAAPGAAAAGDAPVWAMLAVWGGLALTGAIVQFAAGRRPRQSAE